MSHLTEEQLLNHMIDHVTLSAEESAHVAICKLCRAQLHFFTQMMQELEIARRSQPSDAARQRYQALFTEVSQPSQPVLERLWDSVRAHLAWDGRTEAALAGLRSANVKSYRLLYTTARADVELLIIPTNGHRRIQGELLALDDRDAVAPALVQLHGIVSNRIEYETESDAMGRFSFASVGPARYHLLITPPHGSLLHLDALEIT